MAKTKLFARKRISMSASPVSRIVEVGDSFSIDEESAEVPIAAGEAETGKMKEAREAAEKAAAEEAAAAAEKAAAPTTE